MHGRHAYLLKGIVCFFCWGFMELKEFFEENEKVVIAFSGGVDSSYLLYAAKSFGADIKAYYVKSVFQPEFEYKDAVRLASDIGVDVEVLDIDVLSSEIIRSNPEDRCYHCKNQIFGTIIEAARKDGYTVICDGTNASDDASDRPGMRALKEMNVRSPLRECGLTKDQIRELSREAGLFTWDKPSYSCLATRIRTGEEITPEKLRKTEACEKFMSIVGFRDFRIRTYEGKARLEIHKDQMGLFRDNEEALIKELKNYYADVEVDPEGRG